MHDTWVRPRPGRTGYERDAIGAAILALGAAATTALYYRIGWYDEPAPVWLSIIAVAGFTLPLALRRRVPITIAIVVSVAFFVVGQFLVPEMLISQIALFLAIYTVGAWSQKRRRADIARVVIVLAMFGWIAVNLIMTVSDPELLPGVSRSGIFSQLTAFALINFATNVLYFGAAWFFGNRAWTAARERAHLEERTEELNREREHTAAQAVALDRVRIARELHDVVAHHVSVMGVQAAAARRIMDRDPAQAVESLAHVEDSARAAVDELHRLVTTLRDTEQAMNGDSDTDAATESASTRGLDQLPELVQLTSATGIPTELLTVGTPQPVSAMTSFALYRVAQEALTNVRKHAGQHATAEVRLRYLPERVELEVTDTGVGRSLAAGSGSGLGHVGMRERIAAVGGTLEVGPRSRGGYLVRASVPFAGGAVIREADDAGTGSATDAGTDTLRAEVDQPEASAASGTRGGIV